MKNRFKIHKLPKGKLPSAFILNQLKTCKRPRGLIFSTYKSLVLKKNELKSDVIFDKIINFGAYYIEDTFRNHKVVGWCIYIKGVINDEIGIQSMYFTRPLYRGLGLGTWLFSKVINYARRLKLPIWIYPDKDNSWFFRKIRNKYKTVRIENIYKIQ